ncbi:MAG: resolvase [Parcubacteria group bacterium]|nr:resolvase [Parcubacteria group bacterium]|tara:strand:- start:879 stop:1463 length:585 start_codon:yes stop_codon:yes gene_type:complete
MKKKVSLYARVSTNNGQNPETQLLDLRQYCQSRDFEIYKEFVDKGISGAKDRRPGLDAMMKAAKQRKFDALIVFKFDRFARSTKHLIESLELFRSLKIDFISYSESIDTSTSMGKCVFEIMAALAEFERSLIRERILSGIRRAKAQGTKLGRPRANISILVAKRLKSEGLSLSKIGKRLGVSKAYLSGQLKQCS